MADGELVELSAAGNAIRRLISDLGKVPDDLRRRLRPMVREAAQPVLADARRRASWSTRIPAATRLTVSFTRRRAGASIVVNAARAPHARPWEDVTGRGETRHPVYGNRDVWVGHPPRPFGYPAIELHGRDVTRRVNRVVDDAAASAGFKRGGI